MASHRRPISKEEQITIGETPIARGVDDGNATSYSSPRPSDEEELKPRVDSTHRKLKPRHIQLIGIGG